MEKWLNVVGYEGLYLVSDRGNVKSIDRIVKRGSNEMRLKGKTLKLQDDGACLSLKLSKNGKTKTHRLHQLVCAAFIGEKPINYEVLHADGDYTNNDISNLTYDTKSENQIDLYRIGEKSSNGKLDVSKVLTIRKLYSTGNHTYKSLAKMFDLGPTNIGRIVKKEIYKYVDDCGNIIESTTAVS